MIDEDNNEIGKSAKTILKLSFFPVLGALFHPSYQLVNVIFVGRMNDTTLLAAFGLGSLTNNILLAAGINFSLVTGTIISQAAGSGDIRFC